MKLTTPLLLSLASRSLSSKGLSHMAVLDSRWHSVYMIDYLVSFVGADSTVVSPRLI